MKIIFILFCSLYLLPLNAQEKLSNIKSNIDSYDYISMARGEELLLVQYWDFDDSISVYKVEGKNLELLYKMNLPYMWRGIDYKLNHSKSYLFTYHNGKISSFNLFTKELKLLGEFSEAWFHGSYENSIFVMHDDKNKVRYINLDSDTGNGLEVSDIYLVTSNSEFALFNSAINEHLYVYNLTTEQLHYESDDLLLWNGFQFDDNFLFFEQSNILYQLDLKTKEKRKLHQATNSNSFFEYKYHRDSKTIIVLEKESTNYNFEKVVLYNNDGAKKYEDTMSSRSRSSFSLIDSGFLVLDDEQRFLFNIATFERFFIPDQTQNFNSINKVGNQVVVSGPTHYSLLKDNLSWHTYQKKDVTINLSRQTEYFEFNDHFLLKSKSFGKNTWFRLTKETDSLSFIKNKKLPNEGINKMSIMEVSDEECYVSSKDLIYMYKSGSIEQVGKSINAWYGAFQVLGNKAYWIESDSNSFRLVEYDGNKMRVAVDSASFSRITPFISSSSLSFRIFGNYVYLSFNSFNSNSFFIHRYSIIDQSYLVFCELDDQAHPIFYEAGGYMYCSDKNDDLFQLGEDGEIRNLSLEYNKHFNSEVINFSNGALLYDEENYYILKINNLNFLFQKDKSTTYSLIYEGNHHIGFVDSSHIIICDENGLISKTYIGNKHFLQKWKVEKIGKNILGFHYKDDLYLYDFLKDETYIIDASSFNGELDLGFIGLDTIIITIDQRESRSHVFGYKLNTQLSQLKKVFSFETARINNGTISTLDNKWFLGKYGYEVFYYDSSGFNEINVIGGKYRNEVRYLNDYFYFYGTNRQEGAQLYRIKNGFKKSSVINPPIRIRKCSAYPIPATSDISFFSENQESSVFIYNTYGQLALKSKNLINVDIGYLNSGIYYYRLVEQGNQVCNGQFLKLER